MNKIILCTLVSFTLVNSFSYSMENPHGSRRLGIFLTSLVTATAINYPLIKRYCSFGNSCEDLSIALGISAFQGALCISCFYPETEEENKVHAAQFDFEKES